MTFLDNFSPCLLHKILLNELIILANQKHPAQKTIIFRDNVICLDMSSLLNKSSGLINMFANVKSCKFRKEYGKKRENFD
ncbi:hypothetical protein EUGRSUZ_I01193 [Eucalyptus grandis]|uniref:Uncharacterized protein n=2 Tax=Eucalyptus grandis TaxID=71139 RepID=A0ACC3JEC6_EUCGR|nr:hypothetical protein EUGRSUZ_I01193 [Eucalyptus grandis]